MKMLGSVSSSPWTADVCLELFVRAIESAYVEGVPKRFAAIESTLRCVRKRGFPHVVLPSSEHFLMDDTWLSFMRCTLVGLRILKSVAFRSCMAREGLYESLDALRDELNLALVFRSSELWTALDMGSDSMFVTILKFRLLAVGELEGPWSRLELSSVALLFMRNSCKIQSCRLPCDWFPCI